MSIFSDLREGITTRSAEETRELAACVAALLPKDSTLALHGNLGVGKTTFVQGLAYAWGIHETVTSPTFNIFTLHRSPDRTLVHLDAYRLERGEQLDDLMLEDFLVSPYCLAVEWPENVADWLPEETRHLRFSIVAPGVHRVQLETKK